MNASKHILVLTHTDHPEFGHGRSIAKTLADNGVDVEIVYFMKRRDPNTENYIIDYHSPLSFGFLLYALIRFLNWLTFPGEGNKYWFRGITYPAYRSIIKKIKVKPDYIVIVSFRWYLSPRTIARLYRDTKSTIVIVEPDQGMLTGGCMYPYECTRYQQGCVGCKGSPWFRWIPARIMRNREKYLKGIPLHIAASTGDIDKAGKVSFLKDKVFHRGVSVPEVPFVKNKQEARRRFGIGERDYVVMAGAADLSNKYKGIPELLASLKRFTEIMDSHRPVSILLVGNRTQDINLDGNAALVTLGYLSVEDLYTAFYASDVFASPSLYDSGPMMVNYAIACGRPVVAFPVGVALDLVVHKETGWLALFRDTESFAEGLKYYYNCSVEELDAVKENCFKRLRYFKLHPWYEFMLNKETGRKNADTFQ